MSRILGSFAFILLVASGVHAQSTTGERQPVQTGSRIDGDASSSHEVTGDRALSLRLDQESFEDELLPELNDVDEDPEGGWEFHLAPYVWMAGVRADTSVGPLEASGEANFIDLVENLDIGTMLHFEGRKDRWGFIFDGLYMRLSDDVSTGVRAIDIEGSLEMTLVAGSIYYRFGEAKRSFDVIVGAAYVRMDLGIDAGFLPSGSRVKDWVDPFVGGRFNLDLSEKWLMSIRGDIGGFGVGSELSWDVTASVGYQLSETKTLIFGYRHLDIDYQDGRFKLDAQFSGPYFGLSIRFQG